MSAATGWPGLHMPDIRLIDSNLLLQGLRVEFLDVPRLESVDITAAACRVRVSHVDHDTARSLGDTPRQATANHQVFRFRLLCLTLLLLRHLGLGGLVNHRLIVTGYRRVILFQVANVAVFC